MKVVTAVVNNPTFIEIQYHTLQKYMPQPYEFIVFNDAKPFPDYTNNNDPNIRTQIATLCDRLNIRCIPIENSHHEPPGGQDAAQRCADAMNVILKFQQMNPDTYLQLDSDMFLIDHFHPKRYENKTAAIVLQTSTNKIKYFWNGLYYFDIKRIKHPMLLDWSIEAGTDVGGRMKGWLKKETLGIPLTDKNMANPNIFQSLYFINHLASMNWEPTQFPEQITKNPKLVDFIKNDPRNKGTKIFCEIYDNIFLHYRAGGNWLKEGLDLHKTLAEKLKAALL